MNLILLEESDFVSPDLVRLSDRRKQHISEVHRAEPGEELKVGKVNGMLGTGRVVEQQEAFVDLQVELSQQPPAPLPVTLLLALPRPKMLKRILQGVASLGVKKIYLINSYRVEKSFWGSPWLQPEKLREQLLLGLEQARDTVLPEIQLCQRFKPFVEDELPQICAGSISVVAHPGGGESQLLSPGQVTTLAVGPEGGFINYEVEKLRECGFQVCDLGERILRVETAVPVLLSRLMLR